MIPGQFECPHCHSTAMFIVTVAEWQLVDAHGEKRTLAGLNEETLLALVRQSAGDFRMINPVAGAICVQCSRKCKMQYMQGTLYLTE